MTLGELYDALKRVGEAEAAVTEAQTDVRHAVACCGEQRQLAAQIELKRAMAWLATLRAEEVK